MTVDFCTFGIGNGKLSNLFLTFGIGNGNAQSNSQLLRSGMGMKTVFPTLLGKELTEDYQEKDRNGISH